MTDEKLIISPNEAVDELENGGASRGWVKKQLHKAQMQHQQEIRSVVTAVEQNLQRLSASMQQLFWMSKTNGLQIEALVRILDLKSLAAREFFTLQFQKVAGLSQFLDSLHGEHSKKPLRERLDMARNWNADPDHIPVKAIHLAVVEEIVKNRHDFTAEELAAIEYDFDFKMPEPPPPPEPSAVLDPAVGNDNVTELDSFREKLRRNLGADEAKQEMAAPTAEETP